MIDSLLEGTESFPGEMIIFEEEVQVLTVGMGSLKYDQAQRRLPSAETMSKKLVPEGIVEEFLSKA